MRKNALTIVLCIVAGLFDCMLLLWIFDWDIPYRGWWPSLSVHMPSVVVVGLGIALGALWLVRLTEVGVMGASYGWLVGTIAAIFIATSHDMTYAGTDMLIFIVLQSVIGIGSGLIPTLISARREGVL